MTPVNVQIDCFVAWREAKRRRIHLHSAALSHFSLDADNRVAGLLK
jgi:hypothetical protein